MTILNRLGHGYSASRIEECETGMAERFLNNVGSNGVFVPSNISRESSVVFCWDNNDLMEETQTGYGTTHCTNGIVIQRRVLAAEANTPAPSVPSVTTTPRHKPCRRRRRGLCRAGRLGSRSAGTKNEHCEHYVIFRALFGH